MESLILVPDGTVKKEKTPNDTGRDRMSFLMIFFVF